LKCENTHQQWISKGVRKGSGAVPVNNIEKKLLFVDKVLTANWYFHAA
jgi:hypothetical protein